jgi:hypothetical protein
MMKKLLAGLTPATVTSILTAAVTAAVAFGAPLTQNQSNSILVLGGATALILFAHGLSKALSFLSPQTIVGLVTAIIGVAVAFGLPITHAQTESVLQLTALFAGLLLVHGVAQTVARDRRAPQLSEPKLNITSRITLEGQEVTSRELAAKPKPGPGVHIAVRDLTTKGTFTSTQLYRLVWSLWYQAVFQYNRSPWVEKGYATAIADVYLLDKSDELPDGHWCIELLNKSDQEGALGFHEDAVFNNASKGPRKASARSARGLAKHASGKLVPLAKIGVKTSIADGVQPSEVASHEMLEMAVDPFVMNDSELRKVLNKTAAEYYIGEVCDAVQDEGYDVGAPEGRPCGVPEAIVSNFVFPGWYEMAQSGGQLDFQGTRKAPFELAAGGYMSVAPEGDPDNWTQIYGTQAAKS